MSQNNKGVENSSAMISSNLFKSFSKEFPRGEDGKPVVEKAIEKKASMNVSKQSSLNSNAEGFLGTIKEVGPVSLQKRTSKMSNMSDFKMEDNIDEAPLRFFTKQSSFRDFR